MAWDNSPASVAWRGTTNGTTSASINTTGKNFLVAMLTGGSATQTISDSKGNTWFPLTGQDGGNNRIQIYYAFNATVGTGHTFTNAGTNSFGACFVYAFSGATITDPFVDEDGAIGGTVNALAAGSVLTDGSNDLVITGISMFTNTDTQSISAGFNTPDQLSFDGVNNFTGAAAWGLFTGFEAPVWSWTNTFNGAAAVVATFKQAAAGVATKQLAALGVG